MKCDVICSKRIFWYYYEKYIHRRARRKQVRWLTFQRERVRLNFQRLAFSRSFEVWVEKIQSEIKNMLIEVAIDDD